MIAITRLLLPNALIPSTTALSSFRGTGRTQALLSGANVLMPNLTPIENRKNYTLYQNKITSGEETAESFYKLVKQVKAIGLTPDLSRGDYKFF